MKRPPEPAPGLTIRQARPDETSVVLEMLLEASRWVDALGEVMWEEGELDPGRVGEEVTAGQFVIALVDGEAAGAVRFQLDDELFWPDLPRGDSAFLHRLVVRRAYKGRGISSALLQWAVEHARSIGRRYLRLDCDASRPKLQALYERFGFRLHSFRQVGAYYVARYELPLDRATDLA